MSTPRFAAPEAPVLVGRTRELQSLLDATNSPPAVALVEGEAGIGKTRLISEALQHPSVRERRVLFGSCHPLREPFPYGPVFDLLRLLAGDLPTDLDPVCGTLRPYLPELADHLPSAPEPVHDPRAQRHRLFRAVRALLSALGETVVIVEDLHWADDGTRDLLRFLVDDPPANVSAVLSYRREDLPETGLPLGRAYRPPRGTTSVLVALEPLDVHGVRGMFTAITSVRQIATCFAEELHRFTAGIPFMVEEVVRALPGGAQAGIATDSTVFEGMAVPTLLQDAIADRMHLLSPAAAEAVRAASVLRVSAGEALIGAVMQATVQSDSAETCSVAIREALLAGVLHEWSQDRYGFRHVLAQQAVYSALPGPDRRRLHQQALWALAAEEPQPLVQLAHHARQAGMVVEWQRYAESAATSAREVGDLPLAVRVLEDLLADARLSRSEYARIAVELSRDAVLGLTHRRAVELLSSVVRDSGIPEGTRGEIRLNLGLLLNNQMGDYESGRAHTELAVEELRERPALAARGMAALAMPSWGDHPIQVYEQWIERAERLVEQEPDSAVRTAVRGNHLALRMSVGDPSVWKEAEALIGGAGDGYDPRQTARACGNFADAATWNGHFEAAQRFRTEGRRLATACGASFFEGIVDGTALRLDWCTGRWEGLADRARHTLEVVQGVSGIAADAHLVLGLLACAIGDWEEAADELHAAGLADPGNAPATIVVTASAALTQLHTERGESEEARAAAERGIARIRRKGAWTWAGEMAPAAVVALVNAGFPAEAERVVEEFASGIEGRSARSAAAALLMCRGALAAGVANIAEAIEAFDGAQAAYAALPQPYYAARAAEAAAQWRMAEKDGKGAEELMSLVDEFTAIGALRDAGRCRRALRAHGFTLPSRRGRRGYGDEVSPRESEVAKLVALGHTNRQIAETLFLSPRTVEQHVAKVLRKLKVKSRAEITPL
ncbi:AAA family ATPase [Streptomyces sp. NPDC048669]|uniref:helix-turn-helix transcriptional regulator n=1 Tax=Streptomyces sp. NPDC048669 TaxID=3155267 RepID=UPI00343AA7AB